MVPSGWQLTPIKEVCEHIIDCVNKTAPTVDYKTPFKMIRTSNVRNGRIDTENVNYVTEEVYKQWIRRGAPRKWDLIFTREAPVGEIGILMDEEGVFLGQRTVMYRANPTISDSLFLLYSLNSRYCRKQIEDLSNGGTVAHVRVPDCGEIVIRLPPLPEQTKIAQILSTWDKTIETVEKLITNSQQQKKALMQQLLTGKRRFPGFEGEWKTYQLGEFASITMGSSPSSDAYNDICAGLPLLQGNADISTRRSDPRVFTSQITKECHPGDILLSVRAPVGAVAQSLHHACIGRGIAALRAKNNHSQSFLYQWLLFFEPGWSSVSQGSTFESVNSADIKILRFAAPCKDEQECIASILAIADTEIESLEAQLNHLKLEKRALMQQLLTGRRRVKINAEEVATA